MVRVFLVVLSRVGDGRMGGSALGVVRSFWAASAWI